MIRNALLQCSHLQKTQTAKLTALWCRQKTSPNRSGGSEQQPSAHNKTQQHTLDNTHSYCFKAIAHTCTKHESLVRRVEMSSSKITKKIKTEQREIMHFQKLHVAKAPRYKEVAQRICRVLCEYCDVYSSTCICVAFLKYLSSLERV